MSRQASINHEADAQRALSRIVLMLPRTEANGASPSEVDAAAKHIGRLLMAFPELLTLTPKANTEQRTDDTVRVAHGGIVCETRKAVLSLNSKCRPTSTKSSVSRKTNRSAASW